MKIKRYALTLLAALAAVLLFEIANTRATPSSPPTLGG